MKTVDIVIGFFVWLIVTSICSYFAFDAGVAYEHKIQLQAHPNAVGSYQEYFDQQQKVDK